MEAINGWCKNLIKKSLPLNVLLTLWTCRDQQNLLQKHSWLYSQRLGCWHNEIALITRERLKSNVAVKQASTLWRTGKEEAQCHGQPWAWNSTPSKTPDSAAGKSSRWATLTITAPHNLRKESCLKNSILVHPYIVGYKAEHPCWMRRQVFWMLFS